MRMSDATHTPDDWLTDLLLRLHLGGAQIEVLHDAVGEDLEQLTVLRRDAVGHGLGVQQEDHADGQLAVAVRARLVVSVQHLPRVEVDAAVHDQFVVAEPWVGCVVGRDGGWERVGAGEDEGCG